MGQVRRLLTVVGCLKGGWDCKVAKGVGWGQHWEKSGKRWQEDGRDLREDVPDSNVEHHFSRERSPRPLRGEEGGPGKVLLFETQLTQGSSFSWCGLEIWDTSSFGHSICLMDRGL